ncbi:arf-GAP with Rho-GAP domain, ANK repeat and PH domain-containing protein 1 isoform X1 [Hemiscyllium ocellatum]|uniref:arf-GAP with Rho-GAP domain, ANK repeat and PH domain-containing protein 1 isoform X1 n=2 Tax=Hemiscyllium ocellatum TaxID=170820 RepID=UPI0029677839|nr:arf-GAP with Rho-GAP domain, ANK repeat and PH domain-containing protein 1 isoform X1 [Hemiscyllium ocellatum]XP_060682328.1 arf-GAP with Rho-GAP domain, ANK repeat and PH domain-containing protein 1 isoform X1 [Hemiscyllium ocellatum]XP_060682329.1 arf-GAP with Rho-GAP domain, ANK repeat and PH domain-containing protein 1 isoform X1 [Hemiscyllium ocellatum]
MLFEEGEMKIGDWLRIIHLEQYTDQFMDNQYWQVSDCWGLSNDDLFRIGIFLPGHRKRILTALNKARVGTLTPDPPYQEALTPDLPEVQSQKPIPKKRNVYPGDRRPVPASQPPLDKALPPIPPRQTPGRPPERVVPVPRPRSSPKTPLKPPSSPPPQVPLSETPRRDLAVLLPRLDGPRPGLNNPLLLPLPTRPPLHNPAPALDSSGVDSVDSVNANECRTDLRSPPVPGRAQPLAIARCGVDYNLPALPDLPVCNSQPAEQSRCEILPNSSVFFPPGMGDKDSSCRTPCSDVTDPEQSSTGESPSSFFSDDDNAEDYEMMLSNTPGSTSDDLSVSGLRVDSGLPSQGNVYEGQEQLGLKQGLNTSQLCPLIKAGWLDKNPPQGSYIYQRRFVRLDPDYLRYFENDKEVYSKRVISIKSITRVSSVGDQKFEVITSNRTFVFRADSDGERNEWVRLIQQTVEEKRQHREHMQDARMSDCFFRDSVSDVGEKSGYLEIRTCRNKVYVSIHGNKVWLYKNEEDYRLGIGVTSVEMNVATVKDADRRGFDLTTPYKTFSFIAETDNEKEEWVEALRESIAEALSNYEVAEQIWAVESNTHCADCGTPKPEWASINLCLVICKKCAGEHRALGPGISKIRSLKMDKKVWTEQMIKMFQCVNNWKANQFWAANVPPSEAINETSSSMERRRFVSAKYRQGKYRKYHPLFGNQEELNKALCAAVVTSDLEETMSLVFCGADVGCFSGDPELPSPVDLAQQAGQALQVEFLSQNKNAETPRLESGYFDRQYYVAPPSITHNGFLYKTASMGKPITERKSREEFSKRWCVLDNGLLSYYESDRNSTPNGTIEMREVVCLSINSPAAHGFEHTFEVFTDSERLFMFGTDSAQSNKAWVKSIAKSFLPAGIDLMNHEFERIGRLQYKDGLNLEQVKVGWFALVSSMLYVWFQDSDKEEAINLRKLQELSEQPDHDVLVLVEKRRTLYVQAERKLDFIGWNSLIQRAAASAGNTLSEQQLTDEDIPVIVDRCIAYVTQYGLTSEGIYRKSGQKSKTTSLLEMFLKDARSVRLREGEHQVDDVSNTLKRLFRESIRESVFTDQIYQDWLHASMIPEEKQKILQYQKLFMCLPKVNRATLKALINHLYCVQRLSDKNQMTVHNLAIVFGPTLFQMDGQDNKAGRVVEDLINHFIDLFNVDEQQIKKQLDEIVSIIKLRDACLVQSSQNAGDFICTVYLEEKKPECELSLKVPAAMTAQELTEEILYLRKLITKEKDNWCCFEVIERDEMERPLHYTEKVLPILHSLGADSYLVVKKNMAIEAMLMYLASKVADQKHGMVKFREERKLGLGVGSFSDRYFMLTGYTLRLYKEVRSNKPEKEWPVKSLKVYLGVKKKLKPPTCWGFTIVYENKEKHERQHWYVCCDTQMEQREWFATFLYIQHDGNVWPMSPSSSRTSRSPPDSRFNNVSLIPLRGSASEMRNSVAAFTADPLSIFKQH